MVLSTFQIWDPTLATLAAYDARDCILKHDQCRNTHAFPKAGQNLGITMQSDQYLDSEAAIKQSINTWFDENAKCPQSAINSFPETGSADFGHFTQMVQDRADRVGCAAVRYVQGGWYTTYFVCDYSRTNVENEPVYVCGQACSQCAGKCGVNYPGLCVGSDVPSGGANPSAVGQPVAQPVAQPVGAGPPADQQFLQQPDQLSDTNESLLPEDDNWI